MLQDIDLQLGKKVRCVKLDDKVNNGLEIGKEYYINHIFTTDTSKEKCNAIEVGEKLNIKEAWGYLELFEPVYCDIAVLNYFKASGKWYMEEEQEVPKDLIWHEKIDWIRENRRCKGFPYVLVYIKDFEGGLHCSTGNVPALLTFPENL